MFHVTLHSTLRQFRLANHSSVSSEHVSQMLKIQGYININLVQKDEPDSFSDFRYIAKKNSIEELFGSTYNMYLYLSKYDS